MQFSSQEYYKQIKEVANNFESDYPLRFEMLKYILSQDAYTDEYAAKEYIEWKLNDFISRIWMREEVLGYLTLLQVWLGMIRGSVSTSSPIEDAAKIEYLRAMWLEDNAFRDLIEKFQQTLEEAAMFCNLQLMHSWLSVMVSHRVYSETGPQHKLLQGFTKDVVRKHYGVTDSHFYGRAGGFVKSQLAPMWVKLDEKTPNWARSIILTKRQITLLGIQRQGGGGNIEDFPLEETSEPDEGNELTIEEPWQEIELYKLSKGGILIPT